MLFVGIIAVYSWNVKKFINTLCRPNLRLFNVGERGTYSNYLAL
jgi:hypothetical protein